MSLFLASKNKCMHDTARNDLTFTFVYILYRQCVFFSRGYYYYVLTLKQLLHGSQLPLLTFSFEDLQYCTALIGLLRLLIEHL